MGWSVPQYCQGSCANSAYFRSMIIGIKSMLNRSEVSSSFWRDQKSILHPTGLLVLCKFLTWGKCCVTLVCSLSKCTQKNPGAAFVGAVFDLRASRVQGSNLGRALQSKALLLPCASAVTLKTNCNGLGRGWK